MVVYDNLTILSRSKESIIDPAVKIQGEKRDKDKMKTAQDKGVMTILF